MRAGFESNPVLLAGRAAASQATQTSLGVNGSAIRGGQLGRQQLASGDVANACSCRLPLGSRNGRAAAGRIAQARHAAQRNQVAFERELREIEEAVRGTQRGAEERLAAYATARVALGQAEENLRIRQQQFDVGRATSEDVLDAQALLEQQRATLASALYQAHTRRAIAAADGPPARRAGDRPWWSRARVQA
jgi:outer membrane protein TolC